MDQQTSRDELASAMEEAGVAPPDPQVMRLRGVHRAAAEFKRGTPVLLEGADELLAVPAETVGAAGLAEFLELPAEAPLLLLAPVRAADMLHKGGLPNGRPHQGAGRAPARAIRLPPALLAPEPLRRLADPTVEQLLPADPVESPDVPADAQAALALAKIARLLPAVVVARVTPALAGEAAADRRLLRVPADDVLAYPASMATGLVRVAEAKVPLEDAPDARVVAFRAPDAGVEHLAILVGRPEAQAAPLCRIHSECFTGDLLGSLRCDCGPQLRGAIRRMAEEGSGVLIYLAQEGRGIGLVNKLRAYALQDRGLDTVDANRALGWGSDERNFMVAATMLRELGFGAVRLLTNNPAKLAGLAACGIDVVAREPHAFAPNGVNDGYLATKRARFGHLPG